MTSKSKAIWLWVLIGIYYTFIIVTLPYMGDIRKWYVQTLGQGAVSYTATITIITVALVVFYQIIKQRRRKTWSSYLGLLIIIGIYAYYLKTMTIAVEKIHFIEYGLLSILIYLALKQNFRDNSIYLMSILIVSSLGFSDEWVQGILPSRVGEIRDVWFNFVAGALGQGLIVASAGWVSSQKKWQLILWKWLFMIWTFTILIAGFFIDTIQLGYLHKDLQVEFVSLYSFDQLAQLNNFHLQKGTYPKQFLEKNAKKEGQEKAESFSDYLLKLWQSEDFYASEADKHIGARNRYLESKEYKEAVGEQLILNRYYYAYAEGYSEFCSAEKLNEYLKKELPEKIESYEHLRNFRSMAQRQLFTWINSYYLWLSVVSLIFLSWIIYIYLVRKQKPIKKVENISSMDYFKN